jgi:3-oxoacyl-[acyl-carrier protein] reductase
MDQAKSVVAEVKALGSDAAAFAADLGDPEQTRKMVEAAIAHFGRLDILVLNAAIREHEAFENIKYEDWRRVLATDLDSVFVATSTALPALKQAGNGVIITFAGVTALLGAKGRPHVAAAKHGIVGLTKALAQDLSEYGIRVNCVSPGQIDTSRKPGTERPSHVSEIPLGRKGTSFEIAGMVRQLCGPAGAYMTGQCLHINGGLSNSGI